jgi:polysaccharide export outer membrane protein
LCADLPFVGLTDQMPSFSFTLQCSRASSGLRTLLLLILSLGGFFPVTTAQQEDEAVEAVKEFYRLSEGDAIRLSVFNEPDLTAEQKIDPDGAVILPLLGRIELGGMTLREAEAFVEKTFIEEDYLVRPQVTIRVTQHAEQVFYIFGEVNNPGSKVFPAGRTSLDILEAITMAGDLSQYAKRNEIVLRRTSPETGKEEKIIVDLESIIRGSRRGGQKLLEVLPDDIIFVPERLF